MSIRYFGNLSGLILIALGGCAQPRPQNAEQADHVAYTLSLHKTPGTFVQVTLQVRGTQNAVSRLAIAPSWGGTENCERFIHDLRVVDDAGRECPVVVDEQRPHGWDVRHQPGAMLIVTYNLKAVEPDPLSDFKTHYEPVVRDDLLHLIGETALVYPAWLEDRGIISIDFKCEGFEEQGWKMATSFDTERPHLRRTMQQFRHAMFFAGRIRTHDVDIKGGRLRIGIYGEDWPFRDSDVVELVQRIVTLEREFVQDYSDPYFLVTVVPTGPPATANSLSLGGTGLTNCFAMFLAPQTAIDPSSPHRNAFLRLLAHEYFHTWNGGKLATEEPEEYVYWFSEGFTDYYASRILRQGGFISNQDWVERFNETLRALWLSPVATAPAETIRRDFWSRQEVQKLPYNRGEVVAFILDQEIRRKSSNAKNLDEFMREMFRDAKQGTKSQTDRILLRVSDWTDKSFADSLRKVVIDGELPTIPLVGQDPEIRREIVEEYKYVPGFDIDNSMQTKKVTGVEATSKAFAAGLRDGQTIKRVSIYRGDSNREIELTVEDNNEYRQIKYYPRGEAVPVPEFKLAS